MSGSSSTMRTRFEVDVLAGAASMAGGGAGIVSECVSRCARAKVTSIVVPSPSVLCATMLPPERTTMSRHIDSPSPVPPALGARREERLEDRFELVRRNADAVVAHADDDRVVRHLRRHDDAPLVARLDGDRSVEKQIHEDLLDAPRDAEDRRQLARSPSRGARADEARARRDAPPFRSRRRGRLRPGSSSS